MNDSNLDKVIHTLRTHFGRIPTEHEVMVFIFGSHQDRQAVWSQSTNDD